MTKYFYLLLISFTMMFAVSCSEEQKVEFKTNTAENLASAISYSTIKVFNCKKPEIVKAKQLIMVKGWFGLKKLNDKGLVGMICATAVKELIPVIFGSNPLKLDPEFECDYANVSQAMVEIGSTACGYIPI